MSSCQFSSLKGYLQFNLRDDFSEGHLFFIFSSIVLHYTIHPKNPTKYLLQARLKFVRYDGMKAQVGTEINIIKERTFDGAIPSGKVCSKR